MFIKLFKHEITAVSRWYLGLYGAVLLLAGLAGFSFRFALNRAGIYSVSQLENLTEQFIPVSILNSVLLVLLVLLWLATVVSLFLATFFLIIRRFKKTIYGREGYLTLTLPVSQSQIILSKLAGALFWSLLSIATAYLALILLGFVMISGIDGIWAAALQHPTSISILGFVGWLVNLLSGLSAQILLIYLAIAIGQLADRYQIAVAFLAYLGISFLVTFVGASLAWSLSALNFLYIPYQIAFAVLYFLAVRYLLMHKLNLN